METISTGTLLDYIISSQQLKNDAALSKFLELAPPVISKFRSGRVPFGATHIIRLHEKTGWPIADIKAKLPPAKEKE